MYASRFQQGVSPKDEVVVASVHEDYKTTSSRRSLPQVLRVRSLLSFNAFTIIPCLLLGIFWQFCGRPEGIHVSGANHYVLVYGPTAILVWLVAFWRQVDFHVKELTPWNELHGGMSRASQSVLVDYISVLQIAAFWTAVRNRHLPVMVTTSGFTLLKVATLSSTGLLIVQTYASRQSITTTLESKFLSPYINSGNDTALFDKSLFYTTYGILAQNLTKPFGLGDGLAYATFNSDLGLSEATNLAGKVEGFVPSLQCIPTNLTAILPATNTTDAFPNTIVQINESACSTRAQDIELYTLNPHLFRCPVRQLSGVMSSIDCPASVFGAEGGAFKLFALADFRYFQELDDSDFGAHLSTSVIARNWSTDIAHLSGVICRLSYSMQPITIKVTESKIEDFVASASPNGASPLANFNDDDFDLLFRSSISASDGILGDRVVEGYALEYPDPMFKMMALVSRGTYEDLLDDTTMSNAANKISTQLGAQIAHQYLRSNTSSSIDMQATFLTSRLNVATISACILVASLGLVTFMCFSLIWLLRGYVVSGDESTLIRATYLVGSCPETAEDIVTSQVYTEEQLKKSLRCVHVRLESDLGGETMLRLDDRLPFAENRDCKSPWWNPFTVSKAMLTVMFFLTLAAAVVLEILQRFSKNDHGFTTLHSDTARQIVFTHYVPTLFFLLLASMYTCLEFNALLLDPFQRMRRSVNSRELRHRSQLGRVPIFAWFHALGNKSWGTASSTSAALIGSLLTIVVSGLFEVDVLYSSRQLVVGASDLFVLNWTDSGVQDNGASLISSLTENLDFSYPRGTFDEIAYPSLQWLDYEDTVVNSTVILTAPAWRAHLMCQRLPNTEIGVQSSPSPIQNSIVVNASYTLPLGCMLGGPNGSEPVLQFVQTFNFPTTQNSTYIGQLLDLHVGPYDAILGSAEGENVPSAMNDNPLGCPSLGLIYGFVNLESPALTDGGLPDSIAVEVCYQQLQSVQATLTFQNTDFDLDSTQPPDINETSVVYLSMNDNLTSYVENQEIATAFPFRIQTHVDETFVMFNSTNDNIFGELSNLGDTVDTFFQGVLYGRTPIPLTSLKLENATQTSQLQQGILSFYRRYMAQAISSNMRTATKNSQKGDDGSAPGPTYIANAPTAVVTNRMVQNRTSTIILQVMLGVMLVCGIFAACTVQMHNLLPACANPCTIWGQMSLWAGSSIYESPSDAAGGNDHWERKQLRAFERCQGDDTEDIYFKLGWWTMGNGRQRYGIDLVQKEKM